VWVTCGCGRVERSGTGVAEKEKSAFVVPVASTQQSPWQFPSVGSEEDDDDPVGGRVLGDPS
jgi:hypothetical protein